MKTAKAYVNQKGIKIECDWADHNPNMHSEPFKPWAATHYKVTLRTNSPRKQLTTYFSQGMAHTNDPTAEDVVACLVRDAQSVKNTQDFADWAMDLGYDLYHGEDRARARKTYEACKRVAVKIENFLGELPELEW